MLARTAHRRRLRGRVVETAIGISALSNRGADQFAFEDSAMRGSSPVRPLPTRYGEDRRFEVATEAHAARSRATQSDGVPASPSPVQCGFGPHGSKSGNPPRAVAGPLYSPK